MPIEQNSIKDQITKIPAGNRTVTKLNSAGNTVPVADEAEVFQFHYKDKSGEDVGPSIFVSLDGLRQLIVYYDKSIYSHKDNPKDSVSWEKLISSIKNFAMSKQLSFKRDNFDKLKDDMAKRDYTKKQDELNESYHAMGKKSSYSDNIPEVKMIIQHTRPIEEGEQRYRNIDRIFVENVNGERFLLPTNKPGLGRVYARHIAEGGTPYDDKGKHITRLVEEYSKMAGFVRAIRNGQFNESTRKLVNEGINHYQALRETLHKLAGKRGYNTYFESYTPALMEDEETLDLSEMFTSSNLDPRIESVMPILSKLSKNITEVKELAEVDELAEWADSIIEGQNDNLEDLEEKVENEVEESRGHKIVARKFQDIEDRRARDAAVAKQTDDTPPFDPDKKSQFKKKVKPGAGAARAAALRNRGIASVKDVAEDSLNEFDPGEHGIPPFTVYVGDTLIGKFTSYDEAQEEVEYQRGLDPRWTHDQWKIVNGIDETVWEYDVGEKSDDMRRQHKIQFIPRDNKGVAEAVPNSDMAYDRRATTDYALKMKAALIDKTTAPVNLFNNPDNSITLVVNPRSSQPDATGYLPAGNVGATMKNVDSAIDTYYRMFRQKGWMFQQPRQGRITFGVPPQTAATVAEGGKTPKQYWNRDSQSIGSTPDDGLTYADPDEDGVHYPDYANTKDKNSRKFRVKDDDGVETTDSRYRVDPKTKKLKLQHRISIEKESVNQGVAEASKTKKTRNATTDFLGKYPLKPGEIATKVSTKKDNVKTDKQKDINESTDPLIRIKKLAGQ